MKSTSKPETGDSILTQTGVGIILSYDAKGKEISYASTYADKREPLTTPLMSFVAMSKRLGNGYVTWALKGKLIKFSVICMGAYGPVNLGETSAVSLAQAATNILYRLGGESTNEPSLRVSRGKQTIVYTTYAREYSKDLLSIRIIGYK